MQSEIQICSYYIRSFEHRNRLDLDRQRGRCVDQSMCSESSMGGSTGSDRSMGGQRDRCQDISVFELKNLRLFYPPIKSGFLSGVVVFVLDIKRTKVETKQAKRRGKPAKKEGKKGEKGRKKAGESQRAKKQPETKGISLYFLLWVRPKSRLQMSSQKIAQGDAIFWGMQDFFEKKPAASRYFVKKMKISGKKWPRGAYDQKFLLNLRSWGFEGLRPQIHTFWF